MNKIIQALLNTFKSTSYNTGVLEDTRLESEKEKDYSAQEVMVASGVVDTKDLPTTPKQFKLRNQINSDTCVGQSIAKMFEIKDSETEEVWSATPIYSMRVNKPQHGMIGYDALSIGVKQGTGYEKDIPSQYMSNSQIDNYKWTKQDLQKDKPTNYFIISDKKTGKVVFEDLVNAILNYDCAMIYVNASVSEWNYKPAPHNSNGTLRHAVVTHSVIQYNNEPYVVVDDSWGKFWYIGSEVLPLQEGQRMLSKAFIEKHCYFAGAFIDFKYETANPVSFKFEKIMVMGERDSKSAGEKDIQMLQDKLKSLGLFPSNLPSTGYYGNITAKAVYAFQVKYNVDNMTVLNSLKGRKVGSKTLSTLNAQ